MIYCENCGDVLSKEEEQYGEGVCFPCLKGN